MKEQIGRIKEKLAAQGIRFRTRALSTTLFSRLCFADLFVHGIGGAKYDAVTDTVLQRYYHVTPPPYLVVSGTLRLPLPTYPASADEEVPIINLMDALRKSVQQTKRGAASGKAGKARKSLAAHLSKSAGNARRRKTS